MSGSTWRPCGYSDRSSALTAGDSGNVALVWRRSDGWHWCETLTDEMPTGVPEKTEAAAKRKAKAAALKAATRIVSALQAGAR